MSFKKTNIPFKETGMFSKVFNEYMEGASNLRPFYEYLPALSSFGEAIDKMAKYEYPRKLISSTLKEYYNRNSPGAISDATLKNIQKLEDKNCFTVTTGHQICLFTGPLYFIFKIMTAINLAEKLNKEYPANHFVPVYWMATEDHDFAEINHAYLYNKKVEWAAPNIGGPVGSLPLASLSTALDSLYEIIGEVGENTQELKKLIAESYNSEKTLAEGTFSFVNGLLGKYGLVVIDPDNKKLKEVFSPIVKNELVTGSCYKLVSRTDEKLVEAGAEPQVHPREINLFYISAPDGSDGDKLGRNRIEKKGDKFSVLNTDMIFSEHEITELVKTSPEKFSPNVMLRPVYQQCILPNVAYVGGPSEMVYWLQLKEVFENYKIPFPVLMPRNSALMVNKPIAQKMEKLGLTEADLFKDTETLIKEVILRTTDGLPDMEAEKIKLKNIYDALGKQVKEIDPTLVSFTEAELQKQFNALKTLETKLMRVKKQQEETSVAKIRKIKEYLFPGGSLQERTENFIPFYLQQGTSFFDLLKENFDPFEFGVFVLTEE